MLASVFDAIRPTISSIFSRTAIPPKRINVDSFLLRIRALASTLENGTFNRSVLTDCLTTSEPSPQAVSAGKISVAILPGGVLATFIASKPSLATSIDDVDVLTQFDMGAATAWISEVRGASHWM